MSFITRKRRLVGAVVVLAGLAAAGVVSMLSVEAVNWRTRVVIAKLAGEMPGIPFLDLVRWLRPGSSVYLGALAENTNPRVAILNLLTDQESAEKGSGPFAKHCSTCHGEDARGKAGPDLVAFVANNTDWAFFSASKWGVRGTAMVAQPLDDAQIWNIHAWLRDLALRAGSPDDQVRRAARARSIFVSPQMLLAAKDNRQDWTTYAGDLGGRRHTRLAQITRDSIGRLKLSWAGQLRATDTLLQSSPIVAGGLIFVTESREGVVAFDARTGEREWEYRRPVPDNLPLCCGSPNRGAAILGDTLFLATLDAHLVALDAATGKTRWIVKVADHHKGYSMTGAPIAFGDRIVVGVAGGEFGIRGFIAAFSAADGRTLWTLHTVPGPGEPGHDTWSGDSWKTGGAPTWTAGAYDPELSLVFWGVGNPGPPFNADGRRGDNLYSNSVVAIDANSGKLRWHYQFTPADEHDWDAVQQPVLAEIGWQGRTREVVLWANRNAFFYALDRRTGEFLYARPFARQTWAQGFDTAGRPVLSPKSLPNAGGVLIWPGAGGATNWWPPSYDADRQLMYVPVVDAASIFFKGEASFERGKMFLGSSAGYAASQPISAAVKAIDAGTGQVRWEARFGQSGVDAPRVVGGVLSTVTGLVFAGYRETFYAFDSDSGRELWRIRLGARISGPPISYSIDGEQFIAVAAGYSLFVFSLGSAPTPTDVPGGRID